MLLLIGQQRVSHDSPLLIRPRKYRYITRSITIILQTFDNSGQTLHRLLPPIGTIIGFEELNPDMPFFLSKRRRNTLKAMVVSPHNPNAKISSFFLV